MSYWLYCTACEQWSKSATPLSDDKTCSFCHKKYSQLNRGSDKPVIPDVEEVQAEMEAAETTDVPLEAETPAAEKIETSELAESLEEQDATGIETDEGMESSAEEISDPAETMDESEAIQGEETAELNAEPPTSDAAKIKKVPIDRKGRMSKKK